MYIIGMNPYQGLITKTDFKRGKGCTPGSRGAVNVGGDTKEFVAVKLASGTWINGTILQLDTAGVVGTAAAPATAPNNVINPRLGVLVFASATATQTMAGTAYGWAQIYGQALARVTTTVSLFGNALILGSDPGELAAATGALASAQGDIEGIMAIATQSVSGLLNVFLNMPRLIGPYDANLA